MGVLKLPPTGLFVVIEGPDGAGKTSVLNEVHRMLDYRNRYSINFLDAFFVSGEIAVINTAEPFYNSIKNWWAQEGRYHSPAATALAMMGDRYDHLKNFVIPWLEDGAIVLTSRYKASTMVYNLKDVTNTDLGRELLRIHSLSPDPHLQFIITAPEAVLIKRIRDRGINNDTTADDSYMSDEYIADIRKRYADIIDQENVKDIYDSSKLSATSIAERIVRIIQQCIDDRKNSTGE